MNRIKMHMRQQALRKNPDYIRDWKDWQYTGDDEEWEAKGRALRKKYGVKRLPNPFYDPRKRAKEKIWPAQRTSKKYIPLEDYIRVQIAEARDDDLLELKEYAAVSQEYRKQRERREIPLSNEEVIKWEKLHDEGRFQELYEARIRKIESWLLEHPELVQEILKPDPFRGDFMKGAGISYSPVLGLYSLTAYVVIRLFGIRNEALFLKLRDHILKVYQKKFRDDSISHAFASGDSNTKDRALRRIQEKREEIANIPYHLATVISNLAQVSNKSRSLSKHTYTDALKML